MKVKITFRNSNLEKILDGKIGTPDADYPYSLAILDEEDRLVALMPYENVLLVEVVK